MFQKIIFKIGQRLRNPSINEWFTFLKKSESWNIEQLEEYQLERLKEIVNFAYQNSIFYKQHFDANNITPNQLKTLEDFSKFPVLTKSEILKHTDEIHTQFHFKKTFKATTSGSSGDALVFKRDEKADSFNRASIFRGYSWYKIQPWERNGYFWGFNFSRKARFKAKLLDFLQNRFRVFSYEKTAFLSFVKKLENARFIHGYSSMIYQSAKIINTENLKKPQKIKMVKGTSEKILDNYKEEIQKAFNVPIISEYGATESGIIAFECPYGKMHINMEGVFVEEIDHEIVVTNLQMKSFPIIRYKLGDYIEIENDKVPCKCGRAHRILKEVTGRIGENVYGFNNIYPSLYFYYIFKNLSKNKNLKLNHQVIQREKGLLVFNIEEKLTEIENKYLQDEIYKYFDDDIKYEIVNNSKKELTNEKIKSFISYI